MREKRNNRYLRITINGKRLYKHRHIMALHLGRELTSDEVVHHIDGNLHNNDISNLELLANQSEHFSGERHPFYGMTGEKSHMYGVKNPEQSKRMSGENHMYYGKDRPEHSKFMSDLTKTKRRDVLGRFVKKGVGL